MPEGNPEYLAYAPVSSADAEATSDQVVFYQLSRKFVDNDRSIPDEAKDVVYYTLAIGHHTGVIDCFDEKLRCPFLLFEQACACLEEGSDGRYKMEGILRSGEIQIEQSNLPAVMPAITDAIERLEGQGDDAAADVLAWLVSFKELLDVLAGDAAAYIMGRKRLP